jgi:hypothetical protein
MSKVKFARPAYAAPDPGKASKLGRSHGFRGAKPNRVENPRFIKTTNRSVLEAAVPHLQSSSAPAQVRPSTCGLHNT